MTIEEKVYDLEKRIRDLESKFNVNTDSCIGSYLQGTACGKCKKCIEEKEYLEKKGYIF